MLKYQIREWVTNTYNMDAEEFKVYVTEVRFFYDSYVGSPPPKFVQLMRDSEDRGMITECATIPVEMVGDTKAADLTDWFKVNYKEVFKYLESDNTRLY